MNPAPTFSVGLWLDGQRPTPPPLPLTCHVGIPGLWQGRCSRSALLARGRALLTWDSALEAVMGLCGPVERATLQGGALPPKLEFGV